jgi:hypothetical protein
VQTVDKDSDGSENELEGFTVEQKLARTVKA